MAGLFTVRVNLAGVTQFVSTSPIVTFQELTNIDKDTAVDVTARIIGYSYNVAGTANEVRLVLTPANAATGGVEDIILFEGTGADAVNNFANLCGPKGIVVPRGYGIEDNVQPPLAAEVDGATYRAFFSTTGKDDAGAFKLWYTVDGLDA